MPDKADKASKEAEAPMVSHGRGGKLPIIIQDHHHLTVSTIGQGNIGHSTAEYVDGEIVREGPYGDQGDGAYSAGRGGAGNIGSPMIRPSSRAPHDVEVIPELAVRNSTDEVYHTGRGGQGNVHLDEATLKEKEKKKTAHEGLADKLKYKLLGRK
ncbi:Protein of unknown function DUF3602 [Penicillium italicum]|uniref:Uncharacterized protein n=1 Tax=Penicillium italicum TaxID=40296 RepID=A0A0A2KWC8_PENIT|nr:Protein of unknown function DUF3602 [Penicillium italicum]